MPTFSNTSYRWTYQFFNKDLRLIPSQKPKVREAFEECSGLSREESEFAFLPGYVPSVKVVHLNATYGWTPSIGDEIHLAKIFIEELEGALPSNKVPRGQVYAPSELEEKLLLLLEVTALHEMVHYYRRKLDENVRIRYRSNTGVSKEEAWAKQFEKKAYGKFHTVESLSVKKYMPRTAATASK